MEKHVHYRKGKFFVFAQPMGDGSWVYDVMLNGGNGSEIVEVCNAESAVDAMDKCDKLADAIA